MNDLVAFLTARLDEDKRRDWHVFDCSGMPRGDLGGECCEVRQRMLREVAAKRAILAAHEPVTEEIPHGEDDFERAVVCLECASLRRWPCPALRHIAAVYSDHPGYRDEWKPCPALAAPPFGRLRQRDRQNERGAAQGSEKHDRNPS